MLQQLPNPRQRPAPAWGPCSIRVGRGIVSRIRDGRHEILTHIFQVIELVRPLVEAIARRDRDLATQIRRAMSSIGLNCAEAFGTQRPATDRTHHVKARL